MSGKYFCADRLCRENAYKQGDFCPGCRNGTSYAAEYRDVSARQLARMQQLVDSGVFVEEENERLKERQIELLATIRLLTMKEHTEEEVDELNKQNSALIAEVGTLRSKLNAVRRFLEHDALEESVFGWWVVDRLLEIVDE